MESWEPHPNELPHIGASLEYDKRRHRARMKALRKKARRARRRVGVKS